MNGISIKTNPYLRMGLNPDSGTAAKRLMRTMNDLTRPQYFNLMSWRASLISTANQRRSILTLLPITFDYMLVYVNDLLHNILLLYRVLDFIKQVNTFINNKRRIL
jgi:hypothetical protein